MDGRATAWEQSWQMSVVEVGAELGSGLAMEMRQI
jgi:hypothetical protein